MANPKTIVSTVAGATAAAALVTGTIIYSTSGDGNSEATEFIDDINGVSVEIPIVDVPKVQTITVSIPSVNYYGKNDLVQGVQKIYLIDELELKNLGIQRNDLIKIIDQLNKINSTNVTNQTINTVTANQINIQQTNINGVSPSNVDINEIAINLINPKSVKTNTISIKNPSKNLRKLIDFQKKLSLYFKDKRSIEKDPTITLNNSLIDKWIKIYEENKNYNVEYIPFNTEIRMISEACVPKTNIELDILTKNINYFKTKGYTSVLFTFDGSETPENIVKTVKYIKSLGVDVFASYGGKESLNETVFIDPALLENDLKLIAPYLNGYIIGWRRTSCHLLEMDKEFMNFIIKTLRSENSTLPIIGEIYFGNSHQYTGEKNWGLTVNIPENASAVLINNFGYFNIDKNILINQFLNQKIKNFKNMTKIGLVIGERPYYASRNKNNLTYEQNFIAKEVIESEFKEAGCIGTITMANDGNEDASYVKQGDIPISNKLTVTKYYEMQ